LEELQKKDKENARLYRMVDELRGLCAERLEEIEKLDERMRDLEDSLMDRDTTIMQWELTDMERDKLLIDMEQQLNIALDRLKDRVDAKKKAQVQKQTYVIFTQPLETNIPQGKIPPDLYQHEEDEFDFDENDENNFGDDQYDLDELNDEIEEELIGHESNGLPTKEDIKREELMKEEIKREELKKEELKREEIKKEELKREELKREELKKEELKREELKKEELKKEELRREEIKREELRREIKKEESKHEVKVETVEENHPVSSLQREKVPVLEAKPGEKPAVNSLTGRTIVSPKIERAKDPVLESRSATKVEMKVDLNPWSRIEIKSPEPKSEPKHEAKHNHKHETKHETKPEHKHETKHEPHEPKHEPKYEPKSSPRGEQKVETAVDHKPETRSPLTPHKADSKLNLFKTDSKTDLKTPTQPPKLDSNLSDSTLDFKEEAKTETSLEKDTKLHSTTDSDAYVTTIDVKSETRVEVRMEKRSMSEPPLPDGLSKATTMTIDAAARVRQLKAKWEQPTPESPPRGPKAKYDTLREMRAKANTTQ